MEPSIGRVVHLQIDPEINGGADVAPAMITRVNDDGTINVRAVTDNNLNLWFRSVELVDSPDDAPEGTRVAFWPPRVGA